MAKRNKADDDDAVPTPVYVALRVAALANCCRNPYAGAEEYQRADTLTDEQLAAESAAWAFLTEYLSAFQMAAPEVPTDGQTQAEAPARRRKGGPREEVAGADDPGAGEPT